MKKFKITEQMFNEKADEIISLLDGWDMSCARSLLNDIINRLPSHSFISIQELQNDEQNQHTHH